jgi:nitrogenase molybdenum-iron protein alpha chain
LHSYDYGGPYAAFAGAANFWREIDRMINTRLWSFLKAPWQKSAEGPTLNATLVRP